MKRDMCAIAQNERLSKAVGNDESSAKLELGIGVMKPIGVHCAGGMRGDEEEAGT